MKIIHEYLLSGRPLQSLLLYLIIGLPFLCLTINTGHFSDDYQMLLFRLKTFISPFNQNIADVVQPRSDGHFGPVWYLINLIIISLNSSPKFFHLLVGLVNVFTAFVVYRISKECLQSNKTALLAGVLFSLSFSLTHKALTWNVFHSHATNTLTGSLALLILIKFFKSNKDRYLVGTFLLLALTVLNLESGFVFLIVLGTYSVFQLAFRKISLTSFYKAVGIITLAFSLYAGSMAYFSGDPFALLTQRLTAQTDPDLTEELADVTKTDEAIMTPESPGLHQLRSTYAPRTATTLVIRAADLTMKILNLSIIEDIVRWRFYDPPQSRLKAMLKGKLAPHVKTGLIAGGVVMTVLIPLTFFFVYRGVTRDALPFLVIAIFLFATFVVIYNRVDIANSLAIFSSIVLANLFVTADKKIPKCMSVGILTLILGSAAVAIIDGFESTYFFKKSHREENAIIHNHINKNIGEYSEHVMVLVDRRSTFAHPAMSDVVATPQMDLAHYNMFVYRDQFLVTPLAKKYKEKSFNEFRQAMEIHDNVKCILVTDLDQAIERHKGFEHILYVNKNDEVTRVGGTRIREG